MTQHADSVFLNASFHIGDVNEVTVAVMDALAHPPWPIPTQYRTPMSVKPTPSTEGTPLALAQAGALGRSVEWECPGIYTCYVAPREECVVLQVDVSDVGTERTWRWVRALEEILTRLLEANETVVVGTAAIFPNVGGVGCLPYLPLVGHKAYVVAADDDALNYYFESAEAMIAAGGWEKRTINDCHLLSRAMHGETNVEMLEAVIEGQFAMARIAKPGFTRYDLMYSPRPEELEIVQEGSPTLEAVGYAPDDAEAIYSCTAGKREHVRPWEILMLKRLIDDKQLASGEPVRQVTVIFPDRATADREKRPLLDLGVHVQCYDERGELVSL
ncbi:MAG: hypothetical protein H6718_31660 [Polyangiaceae bacterium]|nr:hypothetical protein [Myxococcales bacterium]MCB9590014.1 hypothetical protein [Polyangiaceae bacterium]